jgi:hypothetical protein
LYCNAERRVPRLFAAVCPVQQARLQTAQP